MQKETNLYCNICWNNYWNMVREHGLYIMRYISNGRQNNNNKYCEYCHEELTTYNKFFIHRST